jgi:hypothetical protein
MRTRMPESLCVILCKKESWVLYRSCRYCKSRVDICVFHNNKQLQLRAGVVTAESAADQRAATPSISELPTTTLPSRPFSLSLALPSLSDAIPPQHLTFTTSSSGKSRSSLQPINLTQHRRHGSRGHYDRVRATAPSSLDIGMAVSP